MQFLGLNRSFSLDKPFWILWFLFALACWTLLTPAMARFPTSATAVATVAALVAITVPWIGYPYSGARMLAFLPFFTVGFLYGKRILAWAAVTTWPVKCALASSSIIVVAILLRAHLAPRWFYGSASAEVLKADIVEAVLVRGGLMIGAGILAVTLLAFLPNRKNVWATIGQRSLSVYLMHGFLVLAITPYLPKMLDGGSLTTLLIVAVVAAGTVTLSAAPALDSLLRRISTAPFATATMNPVAAQKTATIPALSGEPVSHRALRQ